MTLKLF